MFAGQSGNSGICSSVLFHTKSELAFESTQRKFLFTREMCMRSIGRRCRNIWYRLSKGIVEKQTPVVSTRLFFLACVAAAKDFLLVPLRLLTC